MNEIILMSHVLFGVGCMIAAVWLFVDVLQVSDGNLVRIRRVSWVTAVLMWIAFVIAGYWYVVSYKVDKAIILKGPWPFAHNIVMETKEHLVIILLLLVTYLPIAASDNLVGSKDARKLMLWANRNGFMYVLDRTSGQFLLATNSESGISNSSMSFGGIAPPQGLIRPARSSRHTDLPSRARSVAAVAPDGPPPTTTTSKV